MKKLRVAQFGTGFVGHFALRAILEHPELELVGVWVHGEKKEGLHAGELAGTKRRAVSAPVPRAAPVTSATFDAKRCPVIVALRYTRAVRGHKAGEGA